MAPIGKSRRTGAGSVFRRADGRWIAKIDLEGRTVYGTSTRRRSEAIARRDERLQRLRDGMIGDTITVGDYFDRWLAYKRDRLRPTTWATYERYLRIHCDRIRPLRLDRLTGLHLADLLEDRRHAGATPHILRYLRTVIRAALAQAVRWRLLTHNAGDAVDPPPYRPQRRALWDGPQLVAFLTASRDSWLHAAFYIAAVTGMRRGEILGLRWEDLDQKLGVIAIQRALVREPTNDPEGPTTHVAIVPPKTERSHRILHLPPDLLDLLRQRATARPWTQWMFEDERGEPAHPERLAREFRRLTKVAELPGVPFHSLRHSYATLALVAGVPLQVVSERLGHHSASFTLAQYIEVLQRQRTESGLGLEQLTGSSSADVN